MPRKITSLTAALAFIALATVNCSADILFYEGFNYDVGNDSLIGQSGGVGFGNTAWEKHVDASVNGAPAISVTSTSIGFSDFATTGNVALLENNSDPQGHVIAARQLPASFSIAAGSTVYQSFLYRQGFQPGDEGARDVSTAYASNPLDAPRAVWNRVNTAFGFNDPDAIGFGYDSSPTGQQQVYDNVSPVLVINKLENVNGAGAQSGTLWMLSEANYDAIKADGITETELDANSIGRIEETVSGVTLGGGDYFQLRSRTQGTSFNTPLFDEIKLFTDLNDLQLTPTAVPEPSTAIVLLLVGSVVSNYRRRIAK